MFGIGAKICRIRSEIFISKFKFLDNIFVSKSQKNLIFISKKMEYDLKSVDVVLKIVDSDLKFYNI